MDAPRYFVTYRHRDSGETTTRVFGRFSDRSLAERIASARFDASEYEVLDVRPETRIEAANHQVSRFITRTLRIVLGSSLALLSWHFIFRDARMGDVPLGRITLNMLAAFGFHALLMLAALVFCWDIAFGEGPRNA